MPYREVESQLHALLLDIDEEASFLIRASLWVRAVKEEEEVKQKSALKCAKPHVVVICDNRYSCFLELCSVILR